MRRQHYGHPDDNQKAIVRALRAVGASVAITTAVGGGFVDLVVGFRGRNKLLENKNPKGRGRGGTPFERAHGGLNEAEEKFHREWQGDPPEVVTSPDEALRAIGALDSPPAVMPDLSDPHPSPLYEGLNRLAREDARRRGR